MQTDPIGYADGLNWYAYVGNDPVNKVDPLGLFDTDTIVVTAPSIPQDVITVTGNRRPDLDVLDCGDGGCRGLWGADLGGDFGLGSPLNHSFGQQSGKYNGPSFCSNPTVGRTLGLFPNGRINTRKNGGKAEAVADVERLAVLNGVPTMASTNFPGYLHDVGRNSPIPISLGNGWTVSRNPVSGYLSYSNSGLTLRTRSTPNSVDINIDIPEGFILPNGETLKMTETCHYRGG